ncbi:AlpA family transcriptional regulator [Halomonas alkaliantarctica]|nr:AlpA family transcriptional regulator [Halomonas alkaliantarctica]
MRLIKLKDVMYITGLARSTVYKYIADGIFPKPVSLGERNVAWVESEIQDWIFAKIAQRDEEFDS